MFLRNDHLVRELAAHLPGYQQPSAAAGGSPKDQRKVDIASPLQEVLLRTHVLSSYPHEVARSLCATTVRHLSNPAPGPSSSASQIDEVGVVWSMQILGHAFSLPPESDADVIRGALGLFRKWICDEPPPSFAPGYPGRDSFVLAACCHVSMVFQQRPVGGPLAAGGASGSGGTLPYGSGGGGGEHGSRGPTNVQVGDQPATLTDGETRTVRLCEDALNFYLAVTQGVDYQPPTWRALLHLLLGVADEVLSGPTRGPASSVVASVLEQQVTSLLFDVWLRAGQHANADLWRDFAALARRWLHRKFFILRWGAACKALMAHVLGRTPTLGSARGGAVGTGGGGGAQMVQKMSGAATLGGAGGGGVRRASSLYALAEAGTLALEIEWWRSPKQEEAPEPRVTRVMDLQPRLAVYYWHQVLHLLGDATDIPDNQCFFFAAQAVAELADWLTERQTRFSGNALLELLGPWLFAMAAHPMPPFEAGRSVALACLCRVFGAHDGDIDGHPFRSDLLAKFYRVVEAALQVDGPKGGAVSKPVRAVVQYISPVMASNLPGSRLLVPPLLARIEEILLEAPTEPPTSGVGGGGSNSGAVAKLRASAVRALASVLHLALHFHGMVAPAPDEHGFVEAARVRAAVQRLPRLLLGALDVENDHSNVQLLLWCMVSYWHAVWAARELQGHTVGALPEWDASFPVAFLESVFAHLRSATWQLKVMEVALGALGIVSTMVGAVRLPMAVLCTEQLARFLHHHMDRLTKKLRTLPQAGPPAALTSLHSSCTLVAAAQLCLIDWLHATPTALDNERVAGLVVRCAVAGLDPTLGDASGGVLSSSLSLMRFLMGRVTRATSARAAPLPTPAPSLAGLPSLVPPARPWRTVERLDDRARNGVLRLSPLVGETEVLAAFGLPADESGWARHVRVFFLNAQRTIVSVIDSGRPDDPLLVLLRRPEGKSLWQVRSVLGPAPDVPVASTPDTSAAATVGAGAVAGAAGGAGSAPESGANDADLVSCRPVMATADDPDGEVDGDESEHEGDADADLSERIGGDQYPDTSAVDDASGRDGEDVAISVEGVRRPSAEDDPWSVAATPTHLPRRISEFSSPVGSPNRGPRADPFVAGGGPAALLGARPGGGEASGAGESSSPLSLPASTGTETAPSSSSSAAAAANARDGTAAAAPDAESGAAGATKPAADAHEEKKPGEKIPPPELASSAVLHASVLANQDPAYREEAQARAEADQGDMLELALRNSATYESNLRNGSVSDPGLPLGPKGAGVSTASDTRAWLEHRERESKGEVRTAVEGRITRPPHSRQSVADPLPMRAPPPGTARPAGLSPSSIGARGLLSSLGLLAPQHPQLGVVTLLPSAGPAGLAALLRELDAVPDRHARSCAVLYRATPDCSTQTLLAERLDSLAAADASFCAFVEALGAAVPNSPVTSPSSTAPLFLTPDDGGSVVVHTGPRSQVVFLAPALHLDGPRGRTFARRLELVHQCSVRVVWNAAGSTYVPELQGSSLGQSPFTLVIVQPREDGMYRVRVRSGHRPPGSGAVPAGPAGASDSLTPSPTSGSGPGAQVDARKQMTIAASAAAAVAASGWSGNRDRTSTDDLRMGVEPGTTEDFEARSTLNNDWFRTLPSGHGGGGGAGGGRAAGSGSGMRSFGPLVGDQLVSASSLAYLLCQTCVSLLDGERAPVPSAPRQLHPFEQREAAISSVWRACSKHIPSGGAVEFWRRLFEE